MNRDAVLRRLTVMELGLSWTEAGKLTLAEYTMLITVGNERAQEQQPEPAEPSRRGGVTRTPIT